MIPFPGQKDGFVVCTHLQIIQDTLVAGYCCVTPGEQANDNDDEEDAPQP